MIVNDALNISEFNRSKSSCPRSAHGFQPEFRFLAFFPHMNMGWFIEVGLVEPEFVSFDPKNDRHSTSLIVTFIEKLASNKNVVSTDFSVNIEASLVEGIVWQQCVVVRPTATVSRLGSRDTSYWDVTAASAWSLNPSAFVTLRIVSKPGTLSPDRAL